MPNNTVKESVLLIASVLIGVTLLTSPLTIKNFVWDRAYQKGKEEGSLQSKSYMQHVYEAAKRTNEYLYDVYRNCGNEVDLYTENWHDGKEMLLVGCDGYDWAFYMSTTTGDFIDIGKTSTEIEIYTYKRDKNPNAKTK